MSDVGALVDDGQRDRVDLYADAVKQTFRSRALRTVLLIDDQFPTYADLLENRDQLDQFSEAPRALALYRLFSSHHMPCDVENNVGELTPENVERIRKSDLIILDYHLTKGSLDTSKSIRLIRKLSQTKHFNIVVLYTMERDLEGVWRDVACSLRCGWVEPDTLLDPAALEHWEKISDNSDVPEPTKALIAAYILDRPRREWPDRQALETDFLALGVPRNLINDLIAAAIHRSVREHLRGDPEAVHGTEKQVFGACEPGRPFWLQSGNCFVAVLGKQGPEEAEGHPTDANRILECLDDALTDWRPNLLQVLISEMQNILELEALATAEFDHLRDPEIQVGLAYQLLRSLEDGAGPDAPDRLMAPVQAIIDKLVETLRHRLAGDGELGTLATTLLAEELKTLEWPPQTADKKERGKAIYSAAGKLARTGKKPTADDVFFSLNCFLATEPFRRGHLTTGTIFQKSGAEEYWVCAAPGCDMVVRTPAKQQLWAHGIHPIRAMVAVRLHPEARLENSLGKAERGRHIFVRTDRNRAFSIVDEEIEQPVYEFFFPDDAARTHSDVGGRPGFKAFRVEVADAVAAGGWDPHFSSSAYTIIGQLRPSYASRILQMAGQHLSRIGVDFIGKPEL
jgi:hypothetical protein